MGSWFLVVLAGLAACGRLNFDDVEGTAIGHDEDGDGIGDRADPCPHVAGDTADRDGDGVGDACDPYPDVPTETLVVFSTLQPGDHPFDAIDTLAQEADALHTSSNTGMSIFGTFGTVRIDVGFEIRGLVGAGQHQVASGIDGEASGAYYFVELNENGALRNVSVVSYDSTNGYVMLGAVEHGGMHPGVGFLRYDARLSAPAFSVTAGWIGELYATTGSTPLYAGGSEIRFVLNGLDVALRYVAIIATN